MLNSAPINSWPLNALAGGAESVDPIVIDPPQPPEPPLAGDGVYPGFPVPLPPAGHSFRWSAVVMMGGVDVSELLTGSIRVDREEGAAGIAEFGLFYMPGQFVQTDLADRTVTIDYITDDGVDAVQVRLFTGLVAEPRWDAPARVMQITATDNLQHKIEAMPIAQIDSLTQGMWSEDVFEPVEGRSRWDYAQERMSTRAASLDCSPTGVIRTSSWYASVTPHYIFVADTTVYQSISVDLAQLRNVTNRVELEVAYRYPRLHDARESFAWRHPGTENQEGISGFCNWRSMSSELPDKSMVISATSGAGLTPVSASWYDLPPTMADPCDTGSPWINNQVGLLLGAGWTGARRWTQSVTETYKLNLATEAGQVEGQQIISRTGTSVDVEHADTDGWESSLNAITQTQQGSAPIAPPNPSYGPSGDRVDESRRVNAIGCLLQIAHTEILAAHRKTAVSWSVPTSMALGVDLSHTVEINDQYTHARAKCSHRVDELNFETGSALTSITISVMRGGGVSDALLVPERLGGNDSDDGNSGWGQQVQLASQLGGRFTSGEYDDELDGFSGNYDAKQDSTLESFPRRLAVTAPPISADETDEKTHELERVYRVGIPNDLLEL
ncbi:MAG: hypothetical protein RBR22_13160 [Desulfuromonas sp.]|nr:hypothetical protein [Desulfuromonas sp.]